jgi:3-methyladenine DNA glycosylase AlkC
MDLDKSLRMSKKQALLMMKGLVEWQYKTNEKVRQLKEAGFDLSFD